MWKHFSAILLRNKTAFTAVILLITVFMAFEAFHIEKSYEFPKILPDDDSTYVDYMNFKSQFGEDGNIMVVGFEDKDLFKVNKFNDLIGLCKDIKGIQGIKGVMSLANIYTAVRNDSLQEFDTAQVVPSVIRDQAQMDSVAGEIRKLKFYEGLIFNSETGANLILITFNKKELDSERRITIVKDIDTVTAKFAKKYNVQMHYSGMPYIRAVYMEKVSHEMTLFIILAVIVLAIILWLFFRSGMNVLFSLLIVVIGVVWSFGILVLFGYKITILSSLIPALTMIIGLPNCIFLINKYQTEYVSHGDKMKALSRTIETIGVTLFLANITTAIGFGVLYFTKSSLLVEFGVVAAISVMTTYMITLILVPVILSVLPEPKEKHTKHLEGKRINKLLAWVDHLVHNKRPAIYITITLVTVLCYWGMTKVSFLGYVVDDLPKNDPVYTDLHFIEKNFKGVLPFEISIDSKKEGGLFSENGKTLYKIKALQKEFAKYEEFSKPVSIVEMVKFSYQVYRGGDPKYYVLPGVTDLKTLSEYRGSLKGKSDRMASLIDSSRRVTRVSYQVADIGSIRMEELVSKLRPKIDSIFPKSDYRVNLTGHSLVFLKNNDYLLSNLYESLFIEIVLIALVGIALFRSVKIIILSKLPCLIPLVITAGIMGFMNIRFKPSTILIFSIAFGISSDGTIYFLTKYRQELRKAGTTASQAISAAIRETGLSMVYTAIILFFGFAIFSASSFGGTVALGVLVSLTLIISMCTNLVMLPAILLSIDSKRNRKEIVEEPMIELENEDNPQQDKS